MLAELVTHEHPRVVDAEVAGMMKTIGIEPNKPFSPDARLKAILEESARIASYMALTISDPPRKPERVRPGSQWMAGLEGYPTFNDGRSTLIDPLIYMTWFATGAAKAMNAPKPGTGSQYAWTYHDKGGDWLLGEKNFRFRIPALRRPGLLVYCYLRQLVARKFGQRTEGRQQELLRQGHTSQR